MKPLNIAIDIRPLMHGHNTGIEVFATNLLSSLFKLDKRNNYILYYNSFKSVEKNFPDFTKYKNVQVLRTKYPSKLFNLSLSFLNYPKIDRLIQNKIKKNSKINKIDIFFMPDPRPIALNEAKLITVFHDLSYKRCPHFFSFYTRIWHKILNFKKIAKASDQIFAVSNFTKQELIKYLKINKEKIAICHEGPGTAQKIDKELVDKICKRINLPKKYFLFISTLEPRKNIDRLIKAYSLFTKNPENSEFKLIIIGKENSKIFRKVNIQRSKNIIMLGFVSELEKLAIISKSYALIYPSLYEGFGLPILESFFYEKPVCASNVSSIPEVIGEAGILFNPLDVEDIKNSMEKISNPIIYRNLSKKTQQQLNLFSWDKCAQVVLNHFSLTK